MDFFLKKKSQISFIILIGVLIASSVLVYTYMANSSSTIELDKDRNYIEFNNRRNSFDKHVKECLEYLSLKSIDVHGFSGTNDLIKQDILNNIDSCIDFSSYGQQGFIIEKSTPAVLITITDDIFLAELDYEISLSKDEKLYRFEKTSFHMPISGFYSLADLNNLPLTIASTDNNAILTLPQGLNIVDNNNDLVDSLEIAVLDHQFLGLSNNVIPIGVSYEIRPDCSFSGEAEIKIYYEEDWIPDGFDENNLAIAWYDDEHDIWRSVPTVVDTVTGTLTGTVTHFSVFSIVLNCNPDVSNEDPVETTVAMYQQPHLPCEGWVNDFDDNGRIKDEYSGGTISPDGNVDSPRTDFPEGDSGVRWYPNMPTAEYSGVSAHHLYKCDDLESSDCSFSRWFPKPDPECPKDSPCADEDAGCQEECGNYCYNDCNADYRRGYTNTDHLSGWGCVFFQVTAENREGNSCTSEADLSDPADELVVLEEIECKNCRAGDTKYFINANPDAVDSAENIGNLGEEADYISAEGVNAVCRYFEYTGDGRDTCINAEYKIIFENQYFSAVSEGSGSGRGGALCSDSDNNYCGKSTTQGCCGDGNSEKGWYCCGNLAADNRFTSTGDGNCNCVEAGVEFSGEDDESDGETQETGQECTEDNIDCCMQADQDGALYHVETYAEDNPFNGEMDCNRGIVERKRGSDGYCEYYLIGCCDDCTDDCHDLCDEVSEDAGEEEEETPECENCGEEGGEPCDAGCDGVNEDGCYEELILCDNQCIQDECKIPSGCENCGANDENPCEENCIDKLGLNQNGCEQGLTVCDDGKCRSDCETSQDKSCDDWCGGENGQYGCCGDPNNDIAYYCCGNFVPYETSGCDCINPGYCPGFTDNYCGWVPEKKEGITVSVNNDNYEPCDCTCNSPYFECEITT
ncbi:hypothetical protein GF327_09050 [Candidatus Woesearchaeota archaeon]|nr:hypothetical protein [Candidatus Woesearchaeota archaeon]